MNISKCNLSDSSNIVDLTDFVKLMGCLAFILASKINRYIKTRFRNINCKSFKEIFSFERKYMLFSCEIWCLKCIKYFCQLHICLRIISLKVLRYLPIFDMLLKMYHMVKIHIFCSIIIKDDVKA